MKTNKIDLDKIKLIIWDLDDTFWKGTLSESKVSPEPQNIELVRKLTQRGVVNSICSKNDFKAVEKEFSKKIYNKLFEYFVFSSIDWSPKGQRIKDLIKNMQLRPVNVLFIDDNNGNLEEAKFYNPELNVSTPDIIKALIQSVDTLGKDDIQLSRLKQYKVLEKKYNALKKSSSNIDFLKDSDIQVKVNSNCLSEQKRILELINRSNQMNYTKIRLEEEELLNILQDDQLENAYIKVKDKYGNYGIVGYYCLDKNNNKLKHFVFSCRILGMGVDQYIYQKLKFPNLNVVGEVSSQVAAKNIVDYIQEMDIEKAKIALDDDKKCKVLFKGPCDLESILPYLDNLQIDKEFIHPNENEPHTVSQQCLNHIVQSHKYPKDYCNEIIKDSLILSSYDFTTNMFSGDYKYVFISTLLEGQIALYRHKTKGYYINYGLTDYNFTDDKNWSQMMEPDFQYTYGVHFSEDLLKQISTNFEYLGLPSAENVLENIIYIRNNLPQSTKLVLILGSEIDCECTKIPGYKHAAQCYKRNNKLLKEKLKNHPGIQFINITDFIESQSDFIDCTNHFARNIYYKLAAEINKIIQKDILLPPTRYKKSLFYLTLRLLVIKTKKVIFMFNLNKRKHYEKKLTAIKNQIDQLVKIIAYSENIK